MGVPAHKVVAKGLAQVPEGRRVFLQMTVEENLEMGAYTRSGGDIDADLERSTPISPADGTAAADRWHPLRR